MLAMPRLRSTAEDKAARAEAKAARKTASKERRAQLWQVFQLQRRDDSRLVPYMIGAFVLVAGLTIALALFFGTFVKVTIIPLGLVLGALAAFVVFSRRAQRSIYRKAEGQAGAAAWVLDNLRGKWRVTPMVAATGQLDAVHRVIGRPGVIFVAEGAPSRLKPLLSQEKKRTARLVGDVPIYAVVVGNNDDEVPLAKLERFLTKLPHNISTAQMDSLESRLVALGSRTGTGAMPKGPLPGGGKLSGVQRAVRRR